MLDGFYYVGQTILSDPWKRWKQHLHEARNGKDALLGWAIRLNGEKNFTFEILCSCPDKEALNSSEKFFIWFLAANKPSFGYNLTEGGSNGKPDKRTIEKISRIRKENSEYETKILDPYYLLSWSDGSEKRIEKVFEKYEDISPFYIKNMDIKSARIDKVCTAIQKIWP
jgi:hypothetical protein